VGRAVCRGLSTWRFGSRSPKPESAIGITEGDDQIPARRTRDIPRIPPIPTGERCSQFPLSCCCPRLASLISTDRRLSCALKPMTGLTLCSNPSILLRPLCERYSSSRFTNPSRPSIRVIRFDWIDNILRLENVDRFCVAMTQSRLPPRHPMPMLTSSFLILFFPSQSSVKSVNCSMFSIVYGHAPVSVTVIRDQATLVPE
jgi:hypothetical protein